MGEIIEQIKWERDVAIEQLKELGYGLGEKIRTSEDCISREYILSKAHCCCDDFADDEPCCVDVDDIKNAPSVQPTAKENLVVEDCVSRELAIHAITETELDQGAFPDAKMRINELPSVQPMRTKGEWIPAPYAIEWDSDAECSRCGKLVAGALGGYITCPYCDADMRGDL